MTAQLLEDLEALPPGKLVARTRRASSLTNRFAVKLVESAENSYHAHGGSNAG